MNKIVISHALYKDGMDLLDGKAEIVVPGNGDSDVIINELRDADGYILRIGKIDRKAIEQCEKLKVITRPGVGYDSVDVEAATERGIPVVLCPSANTVAVAEHTLALIFALAKNIVEYSNENKKGNYNVRNKFTAVNLEGKTVTILGFGNIGKKVAELCRGVGLRVVAYDPYVTEQTARELGCEYRADMYDAISEADIVTIHMPSLPATRGLISTKEFEAMKPTAYLINAARGDIVDEAALYEALDKNMIAGAASDLLTNDPPEVGCPLFRFDNFIITPHSAAQTKESASALAVMAATGTLEVLNGRKWPHVANPQVYERPEWKDR